jgi:hypothetical protein
MSSGTRAVASAVAVLVTTVFSTVGNGQLSDTFTHWLDHPAIGYKSTPTADPVARLSRDLEEGHLQLKFDGPSGYLRSVLQALSVPIESQIAVFAKDSVQRARISVGNPRTLFFNDSVAVGWVRGGFIELAAQDPQRGVMFYVLDRTILGEPRLTRREDCLTCHYSYSTAGVPGMLVRSSGQFAVNHSLPMKQRWGGWYFTGASGEIEHLGNVELDRSSVTAKPSGTLNLSSLDGKFDTAGYLSTYSDIVALMVFDHQMHLLNLLSRIGWEARVTDYREGAGRRAASEPANQDGPIPIADAAREVVDYLLFVNEAPLQSEVRGSSGFAERFVAQGPYDRQGRSLRQLDLRHRLMRYPCSYLIYSPVFTQLPREAKAAIYERMWSVLSGADKDAKYKVLSPIDRRAVVEILRDTIQDLPPYFRSAVKAVD